jgi:dihydrofolate reductase
MNISLIVAMASNRVIGADNKMPWHLPADLKRFRQITMGSPILMGRKTHESIGRVLPGRTNVVITRNSQFESRGCLIFNDIELALDSLQAHSEVFIIGGSSLYEAMLPEAKYIYLTQIHKAFSGDTYFPEINLNDWIEVEQQRIENDPAVSFAYSFKKIKTNKIQ